MSLNRYKLLLHIILSLQLRVLL